MVHELARIISGPSEIFLGECIFCLGVSCWFEHLSNLLHCLLLSSFDLSNGAQACAMKAGVPRAPIATTSW